VTGYYFLVSVGYVLLTSAVCLFEARRIRASGPDAVSMFIALFVAQCCLPGIVIYACLPLVDPDSPTEVGAMDRIYEAADVPAALLVLVLTAWFIFFFYAFAALNARLLARFDTHASRGLRLVVSGSPPRLLIVLTFGLALTLASFYTMGSSLSERYINLILFRAGVQQGEESVLNALGFALTQTWAWLSIPALFVIYERHGRRLLWWMSLLFLVVFVILGVSRRALFIPIVLVYLTLVLFNHRWRLKWLLAGVIPVLIWIAFGKELIGILAFHRTFGDVVGRYETLPASFLRAASDIGITVVESLGSINLLDLPPRFGVDHLLSVLRKIPTGHRWLGDLPARIVRLSTEAFATPNDEDIPPGLFGQMWMDFRIFGPVVWGLILSVQMSIVQYVFARTIRTRQAAALLVLATFVVALPLNTGTYDFSFGFDIYVLVICIFLTFRWIFVQVPTADSPAAGAARK
jgi:hypothetical protein